LNDDDVDVGYEVMFLNGDDVSFDMNVNMLRISVEGSALM
jgi:hypothetical protein